MFRHLFYGVIVCILSSACQPVSENELAGDKVVAEVFNKRLYQSDLSEMIPKGTSTKDSIAIVRSFTNRWAKEAVLLHKAEQNVPDDWNIDALVEDYRASLIRHNYEQALVIQQLDSTVRLDELNSFYERNKEQYQLETPIVRCQFIKLPLEAVGRDQAREWWNVCQEDSTALKELIEYCNLHAEAHVFDTAWYDLEGLASSMPKGTITVENVESKREFTQRDELYEYFFRLDEMVKKREIAPLTYIEKQAKLFILKQRKEQLIEKTKNEIYQDELKSNNIRLFID